MQLGTRALQIGRPPRFSAVHDPRREDCRALVAKSILQTLYPLPRPPPGRHLADHPRAGDGGSSASGTTISSKSYKKTSSWLLSCIKTSHSFFLLLLSHDQHCLHALPAPCSVTSMVSLSSYARQTT